MGPLRLFSGAITAQEQSRAGKISLVQSRIDANAEGDAAREREILRKKQLRRALSSQLAEAGATGVKFTEGSPARIAQLDIEAAERDLAIDTATSKQRRRALISQGKSARAASKAQATVTLLDTAADVAQMSGSGGI